MSTAKKYVVGVIGIHILSGWWFESLKPNFYFLTCQLGRGLISMKRDDNKLKFDNTSYFLAKQINTNNQALYIILIIIYILCFFFFFFQI